MHPPIELGLGEASRAHSRRLHPFLPRSEPRTRLSEHGDSPLAFSRPFLTRLPNHKDFGVPGLMTNHGLGH